MKSHSLERTANVYSPLETLVQLFACTHAEHHVDTLHQQYPFIRSQEGCRLTTFTESTAWQHAAPRNNLNLRNYLLVFPEHTPKVSVYFWLIIHSYEESIVSWRPDLCSNFCVLFVKLDRIGSAVMIIMRTTPTADDKSWSQWRIGVLQHCQESSWRNKAAFCFCSKAFCLWLNK